MCKNVAKCLANSQVFLLQVRFGIFTGRPGFYGAPGLNGTKGERGALGNNGIPGRDGLPGLDGLLGAKGEPATFPKEFLRGDPGVSGWP